MTHVALALLPYLFEILNAKTAGCDINVKQSGPCNKVGWFEAGYRRGLISRFESIG
jgi:hypothetical protein